MFSSRLLNVELMNSFHWYLAVIYNPGGMLIPPPPPSTSADLPSTSDFNDKVETSPDGIGSLDANDETAVDAEIGSAAEGSDPDVPGLTAKIPDSDEPMEVDHEDADESIDELDCIERAPLPTLSKTSKSSPPTNDMKELEIRSEQATRRTRTVVPPGNEITSLTLDAYNNQHQASSNVLKGPQPEPEPVKPVQIKTERPPDHVILKSER